MKQLMSPRVQRPVCCVRLLGSALVFCVMVACMGLHAADAERQLKALDTALAAGILSQAEYDQKKAAIVDSGVQAKLEALDNARQAGILTDAEYQSKKAALTAPIEGAGDDPLKLAPGTADQGKLKADELVPAKMDGAIYRHPTGVSFWYPADWRLTELEGILQLTPPEGATSPENFESYFVTGENVAEEGIRRANDPRVIDYLDELMTMLGAQLGTVFQRQGEATPVTTGRGEGEGVRLDWTAQSAIGPAHAYAMASVVGDYGLVVTGVGVKGLAEKREPVVQRIFASFGVGEGKNDRALVGAWQLTGTYAAQNESVWETAWSKAKSASETKSTLRFMADGTWTREDQFYMIVGAGGLWKESRDVTSSEGRWNADGGHLFMLWKDQSFADYRYRLEGGRLQLLANGKGQTWGRAE